MKHTSILFVVSLVFCALFLLAPRGNEAQANGLCITNCKVNGYGKKPVRCELVSVSFDQRRKGKVFFVLLKDITRADIQKHLAQFPVGQQMGALEKLMSDLLREDNPKIVKYYLRYKQPRDTYATCLSNFQKSTLMVFCSENGFTWIADTPLATARKTMRNPVPLYKRAPRSLIKKS